MIKYNKNIINLNLSETVFITACPLIKNDYNNGFYIIGPYSTDKNNEDNIIYVKGRLSIKEGENAKIIANDFKEINDERNFRNGGNSEAKKESKTGLYLKVNSFSNNNLIEEIKLVLAECQGKEAVYLYAEDTRQLYKWNGIYVDINDKTIYRLESLLPKDNIKIKS